MDDPSAVQEKEEATPTLFKRRWKATPTEEDRQRTALTRAQREVTPTLALILHVHGLKKMVEKMGKGRDCVVDSMDIYLRACARVCVCTVYEYILIYIWSDGRVYMHRI